MAIMNNMSDDDNEDSDYNNDNLQSRLQSLQSDIHTVTQVSMIIIITFTFIMVIIFHCLYHFC